jgi:hypothetical protein
LGAADQGDRRIPALDRDHGPGRAALIGTFTPVVAGCGAIVVNDLHGATLGHLGISLSKESAMMKSRAVAINGSPRMDKGNTARVLGPFIQGMVDAGSEVELFYASRLKLKPCACNEMYCWYTRPGECCIQDDKQSLYPKLKEADTLILATPVYIPLPGAMQMAGTGRH